MIPDIEIAWDVLKDEEKHILERRFALNGGKAETLQQVGDDLGLSRERIRQLQNIALSKLRRAMATHEEVLVPVFYAPKEPEIKTPVKPRPKPKPRPKRKPKRVPKIPKHTDAERIDWLEETIRYVDMKIDHTSCFGTKFTLSHAGLSEVQADNLRDLISLAISKENIRVR